MSVGQYENHVVFGAHPGGVVSGYIQGVTQGSTPTITIKPVNPDGTDFSLSSVTGHYWYEGATSTTTITGSSLTVVSGNVQWAIVAGDSATAGARWIVLDDGNGVKSRPVRQVVYEDPAETVPQNDSTLPGYGSLVQDVADLVSLSGMAENSTTFGSFTGSLDWNDQSGKGLFQTIKTHVEGLRSATEANVVDALNGATLTAVAVEGTDKVLIQDGSDGDNVKAVTAQSIADLAVGHDAVRLGTNTGNALTLDEATQTLGIADVFLQKSGDTVEGDFVIEGYMSIEGSANRVQQTIQGHTIQTNPLTEWKNYNDSVMAKVDEDGYVHSGRIIAGGTSFVVGDGVSNEALVTVDTVRAAGGFNLRSPIFGDSTFTGLIMSGGLPTIRSSNTDVVSFQNLGGGGNDAYSLDSTHFLNNSGGDGERAAYRTVMDIAPVGDNTMEYSGYISNTNLRSTTLATGDTSGFLAQLVDLGSPNAANYKAFNYTGSAGFGFYQSSSSVTNYFGGKLGLGEPSPDAELHVNGGIIVADTTETATAGLIVFDGTRHKCYDGTTWHDLY